MKFAIAFSLVSLFASAAALADTTIICVRQTEASPYGGTQSYETQVVLSDSGELKSAKEWQYSQGHVNETAWDKVDNFADWKGTPAKADNDFLQSLNEGWGVQGRPSNAEFVYYNFGMIGRGEEDGILLPTQLSDKFKADAVYMGGDAATQIIRMNCARQK